MPWAPPHSETFTNTFVRSCSVVFCQRNAINSSTCCLKAATEMKHQIGCMVMDMDRQGIRSLQTTNKLLHPGLRVQGWLPSKCDAICSRFNGDHAMRPLALQGFSTVSLVQSIGLFPSVDCRWVICCTLT